MGRLGDWLLEHLPPSLRPTLTAAQVEGYERELTAAVRAGQLVRDVEFDLAQLEAERRQQGWTGEYAETPPPPLTQLAAARDELSLAEGARANAAFMGHWSEHEVAEQRVAHAREALQEAERQAADAAIREGIAMRAAPRAAEALEALDREAVEAEDRGVMAEDRRTGMLENAADADRVSLLAALPAELTMDQLSEAWAQDGNPSVSETAREYADRLRAVMRDQLEVWQRDYASYYGRQPRETYLEEAERAVAAEMLDDVRAAMVARTVTEGDFPCGPFAEREALPTPAPVDGMSGDRPWAGQEAERGLAGIEDHVDRWREEAEQLDVDDRAVRSELSSQVAEPSEEGMAAQDAAQVEGSTGTAMAAELGRVQPAGAMEPQ